MARNALRLAASHYSVEAVTSQLLDLYAASVHAAPPPDLTRMPHAKQTNPWRGAVVMAGVAVVVGIGLIGSIRWIYLNVHRSSPVHSAPAPAAAASNS